MTEISDDDLLDLVSKELEQDDEEEKKTIEAIKKPVETTSPKPPKDPVPVESPAQDSLLVDEPPKSPVKQETAEPVKREVVDDLVGTPSKPTEPEKSITDNLVGSTEKLELEEKAAEQVVEQALDLEPISESPTEDILEPEKILLYGSTKVGKTHAIASLLEAKLEEAEAFEGEKDIDLRKIPTFHVVITDSGFWKTIRRYWRLRNLDLSVLKSQVKYYSILDINEMFPVIEKIKAEAKPIDWIIVDVISDFWDRSQDKFIESCSSDRRGFADIIVEASQDPSKFGVLSGLQWGYCKRLDSAISYYFIISSPCNIIATASEKDLGVAEAIAGKKTVQESLGVMYESFRQVGYRPDGQKRLPYKFDDIIFLGKSPNGQHSFIIVGSRDIDTTYETVPYSFSFWKKFISYKTKKAKSESSTS